MTTLTIQDLINAKYTELRCYVKETGAEHDLFMIDKSYNTYTEMINGSLSHLDRDSVELLSEIVADKLCLSYETPLMTREDQLFLSFCKLPNLLGHYIDRLIA